jgi:plasmid stabilization system protein ParE
MWKLIWLDSAVNDIVRLRKFIAQENPEAAKRAADAIKEATQRLQGQPAIGKTVQDLLNYRDLFIRFGAGGYILRYRIHLDTVYIVHIRHYREADFKL